MIYLDASALVAQLGGLTARAGSRQIRALPATADVFVAAGRFPPPTLRSVGLTVHAPG